MYHARSVLQRCGSTPSQGKGGVQRVAWADCPPEGDERLDVCKSVDPHGAKGHVPYLAASHPSRRQACRERCVRHLATAGANRVAGAPSPRKTEH